MHIYTVMTCPLSVTLGCQLRRGVTSELWPYELPVASAIPRSKPKH
jgi:hypothetical protein